MILPIFGRFVATFYIVAPFVACFMVLINPPLAFSIFLVWIISAGTMIALALLVIALAQIWGPE